MSALAVDAPNLPKLRFEPKLVILAIAFVAAAFVVPPLFRTATIALAFAMLALAPMPKGTRALTFAVMAGLATGTTAISTFAVSIFQAPVTHEFGWSQTKYSTVLTLGALVLVFGGPFAGRVFDRYGVRKFTIASILLMGLLLISLHWQTSSIGQFYATYCLIQFLGFGTSSIAYSRIVARWFRARRGQAFGTALAGVGVGGAVLSALSQSLISAVGWRDAYVGLGLFLICVVVPIVFLWLRDNPEDIGLGVDGVALETASIPGVEAPSPVSSQLVGLTAGETRRTGLFWYMMVPFFIMGLGTGGIMLQLFPILLSHGISAQQAAAIQGALGLALIAGRAFAGALMDRFFAPYIAASSLLFPLFGSALLALGVNGLWALIAALCIGLSTGAEVDIVAYLITRYFGTRAYSENYGWLYGGWALGAGLAPMLSAQAMDRLGSFSPALWLYVGMFAVAAAMLARLRPYPILKPAPLD